MCDSDSESFNMCECKRPDTFNGFALFLQEKGIVSGSGSEKFKNAQKEWGQMSSDDKKSFHDTAYKMKSQALKTFLNDNPKLCDDCIQRYSHPSFAGTLNI